MILSLCGQHKLTQDQIDAGLVEYSQIEELKKLLNFKTLPTKDEIAERARKIVAIAVAEGCDTAMIGGAPYLMGALESRLKNAGIKPVYAFSERVTVEKEVDGKIVKTSNFKHLGFVEV